MSLLDRLRGLRSGVRLVPAETVEPGSAADVELEYQGLLSDLEAVRRSIADANATRRRLEARSQQVERARDAADERARIAVREGREDLARTALAEALRLEHDLEERAKAIDSLAARAADLRAAAAKLEARIHDYRDRLDTARTRAGGGAGRA